MTDEETTPTGPACSSCGKPMTLQEDGSYSCENRPHEGDAGPGAPSTEPPAEQPEVPNDEESGTATAPSVDHSGPAEPADTGDTERPPSGDSGEEGASPESFACPDCGFTSATPQGLANHRRKHE